MSMKLSVSPETPTEELYAEVAEFLRAEGLASQSLAQYKDLRSNCPNDTVWLDLEDGGEVHIDPNWHGRLAPAEVLSWAIEHARLAEPEAEFLYTVAGTTFRIGNGGTELTCESFGVFA